MTYRDPKTGRWATPHPFSDAGGGLSQPLPVAAMKQEAHTVFVYGTLKEGHGNWRAYLKGRSTFVGHARTVDNFSMANFGAPVVFRVPALAPVRGEVYRVSADVLRDLDRLEGYRGPGEHNNYDRAEVEVLVQDAVGAREPIKALMYLSERPMMYKSMGVPVDADGLLTWSPNKNLLGRM